AGGRRQAERVGGVVDLGPGAAPLDPDRPPLRIDPDLAHVRQVDDDAAVADRQPGDVMAAAPDRYEQVVLPREADRVDHVVGAGTADDQRRAPVDHGVVDPAGLGVGRVAGLDQRAAQPRGEGGHGAAVEVNLLAGTAPRTNRWHD